MDEILRGLAFSVLYREDLHRRIWGRGLYDRQVLKAADRVLNYGGRKDPEVWRAGVVLIP